MALVAAMVLMGRVNWVTMEAVLEVVEATTLEITIFNLQMLEPGREKILEAEALFFMVV